MADTEKAAAAIDKHLRGEEGERTEPYLCEAKVPTIGVGATTYPDGRKVKLSDPAITIEQMNRMLELEIARYINAVLKMVDGECTTNQLIALVICAYNIGLPAMAKSSMIKAHLAKDFAGAARAFRFYNKYRPDGPGTALKVHPVLEARRAREAALYLTSDGPAARPPQAVEPESSAMRGPIATSGASVAGVGGLAAIFGPISDQVESVKGFATTVKGFVVDTLGVPADWVLPLVLIGCGYVVLKWRAKQRSEGWA